MAPYEITHAGGSVEHWNEEPGAAWMGRFSEIYDKVIWPIQRLKKPGSIHHQ